MAEPDQAVRVLVVDDHPALRLGLRAMLTGQPDLRVVGEARDDSEALLLMRSLPAADRPQVVLVDLHLGVGLYQGVDLVRMLASLSDPPAVLVLSAYGSDQDVFASIDAGAAGFLGKEAAPAELLGAVRTVARGGSVLGPRAVGRLMGRMRGTVPQLSPREAEVLQLLADGLSNRQISARLFISEATAKSHLTNIYGKLGVDRRGAAVAAARRDGLLRIG
jgi:DNA-binding NarL/FixJ family response regulator